MKSLGRVPLFAIPWTVARQAPLSMGFPRPEYSSGLPFSYPGGLPNPGTEPGFPALQVDALPSDPLGKSLGLNTIPPNKLPLAYRCTHKEDTLKLLWKIQAGCTLTPITPGSFGIRDPGKNEK